MDIVMERESQQGMQSLHRDLIFQLLSWASPETLPVCRQVCPMWRSIVDDPQFPALHLARGQARCTVSGYFVHSDRRFRSHYNVFFRRNTTFVCLHPIPRSIPTPSIDFLPGENIRIWCSSRFGGLLCCEAVPTGSQTIPRYYICKPTTLQWREIPNPETEYFTVNISMVVRSTVGNLDFKVVRFSIPSGGGNQEAFTSMHCEIFESATWVWKQLGDVWGQDLRSLSTNPGVEIGGVVHWLLTEDHASVFAFDVRREDWKLIQMPQLNQRRMWSKPMLVASDGELCLLRFRSAQRGESRLMDMWVMKKNSEDNNLWERKGTHLLKSEHTVRDLCSSNVSFQLDVEHSKAIWFDMSESVNLKEVQLYWHSSLWIDVFKFESDHIPISWGSRTE